MAGPSRYDIGVEGVLDRAGTSGFERVGPIRPVSGSRSVRVAEFTLPQLSGSIPSLAFGGSKDLRAEEGILHCAWDSSGHRGTSRPG